MHGFFIKSKRKVLKNENVLFTLFQNYKILYSDQAHKIPNSVA